MAAQTQREMNSEDIDAIVERRLNERMEQFLSDFAARSQPESNIGRIMEQLATKIADVSDQAGGGRVGARVDPELLRQREVAHMLMLDRIVDARRRQVMPTYRLKNKVQLDDTLIEPFYIDQATKATKQTEIGFDGIPCEAMEPIDEEAKAIYEAYRGWIGNLKKVVPEDRLGITTAGVVVKNGAVQMRREVPGAPGDPEAMAADRRPNVAVSHLQRGQGQIKRILGKTHPPAVIGP